MDSSPLERKRNIVLFLFRRVNRKKRYRRGHPATQSMKARPSARRDAAAALPLQHRGAMRNNATRREWSRTPPHPCRGGASHAFSKKNGPAQRRRARAAICLACQRDAYLPALPSWLDTLENVFCS
jgi:hypothetical protein